MSRAETEGERVARTMLPQSSSGDASSSDPTLAETIRSIVYADPTASPGDSLQIPDPPYVIAIPNRPRVPQADSALVRNRPLLPPVPRPVEKAPAWSIYSGEQSPGKRTKTPEEIAALRSGPAPAPPPYYPWPWELSASAPEPVTTQAPPPPPPPPPLTPPSGLPPGFVPTQPIAYYPSPIAQPPQVIRIPYPRQSRAQTGGAHWDELQRDWTRRMLGPTPGQDHAYDAPAPAPPGPVDPGFQERGFAARPLPGETVDASGTRVVSSADLGVNIVGMDPPRESRQDRWGEDVPVDPTLQAEGSIVGESPWLDPRRWLEVVHPGRQYGLARDAGPGMGPAQPRAPQVVAPQVTSPEAYDWYDPRAYDWGVFAEEFGSRLVAPFKPAAELVAQGFKGGIELGPQPGSLGDATVKNYEAAIEAGAGVPTALAIGAGTVVGTTPLAEGLAQYGFQERRQLSAPESWERGLAGAGQTFLTGYGAIRGLTPRGGVVDVGGGQLFELKPPLRTPAPARSLNPNFRSLPTDLGTAERMPYSTASKSHVNYTRVPPAAVTEKAILEGVRVVEPGGTIGISTTPASNPAAIVSTLKNAGMRIAQVYDDGTVVFISAAKPPVLLPYLGAASGWAAGSGVNLEEP